MKRIVLLFSLISIIFLVGCENEEANKQTSTNTSQKTTTVETKNSLAKELKIEKTSQVTGEGVLIPFDINYSKEYIKVLEGLGTDAECYTYMQENSFYPLLVVKFGHIFNVYEYKNGKAIDVSSLLLVKEFDESEAAVASYGIDALKSTIDDYNSIYSEYQSIGNRDFDTFMKNRYEKNKELGTFSYKYDYLDAGTTVLGEEKGYGYIEDGKYKIHYEDVGMNRKLTITVNGIEADNIAYVHYSSNVNGSGILGNIYFLMMNGDIYETNFVEVLPEYDEMNTDGEEEVTVNRINNIEKAVSIIYAYSYPYYFGMSDALDSELFALTYDGILYKLNEWNNLEEVY